MGNRRRIIGLVGAAVLGLAAGDASAAPQLRVQVNQRGDFALIGNTLAHECAPNTPPPVVGTVGSCGTIGVGDSTPDVFWRGDYPDPGKAYADVSNTVAQARSSAILSVPAGATITHAYLYWAARSPDGSADATVKLDRQGGFSTTVTAAPQDLYLAALNGNVWYQSVADVTSIVKANGIGSYRVGEVAAKNVVDIDDEGSPAAWWLAVFYELDSAPYRNLALFDGLDVVSQANEQSVTLSGFSVPMSGFDAKLGVVAFEGDNAKAGDALFFNGGTPLSDAQNPGNNFFNSTRTFLGAPVSVPGDLPQLQGTPQSMSGIDLDVIDIKSKVAPGQSSASIKATANGDNYLLAGWLTSISGYRPDFSTSTKSVTDVNGGSLLVGDELEYMIIATNTGNDTAIDAFVTDPLPTGVTFVPGSLEIINGPNTGAKTDAAGDDQGEYDAASRTVTFRLGTGANGASGGSLAPGGSTTVRFRVTIDAGTKGSIQNQATITASGEAGEPPHDFVTDGNGQGAGSPPTDIVIDECGEDADCPKSRPRCDTEPNPNVCTCAEGTVDCPDGGGAAGGGGAGGGDAGGGGATGSSGFYASGNGLLCQMGPAGDAGVSALLLGLGASAWVGRRRRRR